MGGRGSGEWERFSKKATVEESLVVAVRDLRGRLNPGDSGSLAWTNGRGNKSSVGYLVSEHRGAPLVTLHYQWDQREDVRIPLRVQSTPVHFGGSRQWFTCPLIVDGVACNRRVGKVYLPPGAKYFGCRTCHGLTYRSCQEAHCFDDLYEELAAKVGCDVAFCRKTLFKPPPNDNF